MQSSQTGKIYCCPLSQVDKAARLSGARHMISLIGAHHEVERPAAIPCENHLHLGFNDISEPIAGMIAPGAQHIEQLIVFARMWDKNTPLLVHCWAGISRSTAAVFAIACLHRPEADEFEIAEDLRIASPSATPNRLLVRHADELLGRSGRMVEAVERIGRGADAYEGDLFSFPV